MASKTHAQIHNCTANIHAHCKHDCIIAIAQSQCCISLRSHLLCGYADAVQGVFVFLGIGNSSLQTTEKLHTPLFKMDDSMMPVGAALHTGMALQWLKDGRLAGKAPTETYKAQSKSDEL